jgi:hypothetical protein
MPCTRHFGRVNVGVASVAPGATACCSCNPSQVQDSTCVQRVSKALHVASVAWLPLLTSTTRQLASFRSCLINLCLSPNAQLARGASPLQAALRGFLLILTLGAPEFRVLQRGNASQGCPCTSSVAPHFAPCVAGLMLGHAAHSLSVLSSTLHSAHQSPKTIRQ